MTDELSEQWELWKGSEEPEACYMAYIRNRFPAKMNRSRVSKRSDRTASHGYQ
jgi:hypothetical protein